MFSYYSIIIILAISSMIIMEWCVSNNSSLTTKSKQLFAVMYLVIMICAAAEWLGLHLQGRSSQTRVLHIIVKTIELSLAPWIGVLCTAVVNQSARIKKVAVIMFANVDALNESFDQSIRQLRKEDYRMPNVSIGYAYYDPCENNIQDAIREADEMLYRNKEKHDAVRGM